MLSEQAFLQSANLTCAPCPIQIDAQAGLGHHQHASAGLLYLPARDAVCAQDAHDGGDARIQEIAELARWGARGRARFASATNDVYMQIYQAWC